MTLYYQHRFELPDRPGTTIFVQTEDEVEAGRRIIDSVALRWGAPSNFYHLLPGGHIRALRKHEADNVFVRLDIENFFGSITRNKIHQALKKIGFSFAGAQKLSHRSSVQHQGRRILPFGYVQSPILASLVLDKSALGKAMRQVAQRDLRLSVFMDDIILSHRDSSEVLLEACATLQAASEDARLHFSEAKQQGPAEKIIAFNIKLSHELLEITADRFALFEQHVMQFGDCPSTDGVLGYVEAVNQTQLERLEQLLGFGKSAPAV